MESIISTFHIDWKIIIAQIINFGIVFIVLYIYALKPLSKLMAERSEKISKGIKDAKENNIILEKTQKECDLILANARKEAVKIFEENKKEANSKREKMLSDAKLEVEKLVADGKQVLETEKIKIVKDAKKEIINLVILSTEKLLGSKVDASFDRKILDELNNL